MRKVLVSLIVTGVAITFLGFSLAYSEQTTKDVTVVDIKGKVEVMSQGSSAWMPATVWMKLGSGDTVRTKANSYADLNFNGMGQSALVRVDEKSSLKIDSYIAAKEVSERKISLNLAIGDILVKANKLKDESQFQVRTPTSIVGVRGTGFKVQVSSEE